MPEIPAEENRNSYIIGDMTVKLNVQIFIIHI